MLYAVTVRAQYDAVGDRVQAAQGLADSMVRVAFSGAPTTPFASVPVVANNCFSPAATRSVAVLTIKNGVAFCFVPSAPGTGPTLRNGCVHAPAGLAWVLSDQRVGCDHFRFAAVAQADPRCVPVRVIGGAANDEQAPKTFAR